MSWNTEITAGSKSEAKDLVAGRADPMGEIPINVAGAICAAIEALPDCPNSHIDVTTYGHFHDSPDHRGGSNMRIIIQQRLDAVGDVA